MRISRSRKLIIIRIIQNDSSSHRQAVVKYDVVEKLIKGDGVDPINGEQMTEDDIIELQRGGTGYAATNEVKAKLIRPQLELQ